MRPIAAGGVTLLLGALGLTGLLIQALGQSNPSAVAAAVGFNNAAGRLAAAQSVEAGQNQTASKFAKQAVAAMPLDQFSVAVSSVGQSADGQLRILNLAAALGWRDPATNIALIESGLREGRPDIAAQRIDAAGRILGAAPVINYTDQLLAQSGGMDELTKRAKTRNDGAWWQGYFRSTPKTRDIAEARAQLIGGFDKGDGAWLRRTIRDASIGFGRVNSEDLSIALARGLSASASSQLGPIYDRDFAVFDPSVEALIGEWQLAADAPALVELNDAAGVSIERTASRGGGVLTQRFAIASGKWTLKVLGAAPSPNAYRWRITCAGENETPMAPVNAVDPAGAIGEWSFTLAKACPTALITLTALQRDTSSSAITELHSVTLVPS